MRGVAGTRWLLALGSSLTLALHLLSGCSKGGYMSPPADGSVRPPRDLSDVVSVPDLRIDTTDGSTDFGSPTDLAVPHDLTVTKTILRLSAVAISPKYKR